METTDARNLFQNGINAYVFIVNFEQILPTLLVFSLMSLKN